MLPAFAYATPTSWDYTSNILRPLQFMWDKEVQVPWITATSTDSASSIAYRLGIGTTTPEAELVVIGSTTISSLSASNCDVKALTTGALYCGTDATGSGGDSISIDGSAVTDPDFVSTGDIDFVDTSNTITANINAGSIIETDLNINTATDDYVLTASSTATGGWIWGALSGSGITSLNSQTGSSQTFATGTATGIGLNIVSGSDIHTFTPTVSSGYVIPLSASTTEWATAYAQAHDAVTLAGEDFLSLSTQQITANAINADNLSASDFGDFTCNGTTCSFDADTVGLSELDLSISPTWTGNHIFEGSVTASSTNGVDFNPASDTDTDLLTVNVTGSPTFSWNETSDAFISNKPYIISSDGNGDITHSIGGTSVTSDLEIHSEGSSDLGGIAIHRHTNADNLGGHLLFLRSDGTHGTPGVTDDNDTLGRLIGLGYDGTDYEFGSEIRFRADGNYSNNNGTGDIAFFTNPGGQSLSERMTIAADGSVIVATLTDGFVVSDASGVLSTSTIGVANLTSEDFGDFTCNGTTCSLDSGVVSDNEIDYTNVTLNDLTFDVGSVSKTEFGYLNGVTSAIQTQLDGKEGTLSNEAGLYSALSDVTQFWEAGDTLSSGAISSGFGNIDIGSSNLDADGTITFGGLAGGGFVTSDSSGVLSTTTPDRGKEVPLFGSDTAVAAGSSTTMMLVDPLLNGKDVSAVYCGVTTQGVTGTTDVTLWRARSGTFVEVLSTDVTLGAEYYVADGTINTSNDDLATGDQLFFEVIGVHSGTAPNGLTCGFNVTQP